MATASPTQKEGSQHGCEEQHNQYPKQPVAPFHSFFRVGFCDDIHTAGCRPVQGGFMNELFVWAHRGASNDAPENTMSAFQAAAAAGANGIELDVHLSRDGIPMVIHDETLDRTTNGSGPVGRMRAREIHRLDAGRWYDPVFAGESVPALEEILQWAGDGIRINIEIKDPAAVLPVLKLVRNFPMVPVLVSSFNAGLLEDLRRKDPELPLGFLCDSHFWRLLLQRAEKCRAESFHPNANVISRPLVAACRRRGLAVYPWTFDWPGDVRNLRRLGVQGFFTNSPGIMVRRLNSKPAQGNL